MTWLHLDVTPLYKASRLGHGELVSLLLVNGANIDTTTNNGTSALLLACRKEPILTFMIMKTIRLLK